MPEIDRLVEVAGLLGEHVAARDAEVGGAVLDVGRHVDRLDQQHAVAIGQVDREPPIIGARDRLRGEPRLREHPRGGGEDPPLGEGEREGSAHQGAMVSERIQDRFRPSREVDLHVSVLALVGVLPGLLQREQVEGELLAGHRVAGIVVAVVRDEGLDLDR